MRDGPSISDYFDEMVRAAKRAENDRLAGLYRGRAMAGKKDTDATKNLPPDEPTQVGPGGTKLGLPKRSDVDDMLRRLSGKKKSS